MNGTNRFLADLQDDLEHNRVELPTLPEVALRVRDAVEDPDATATKVGQILENDPALSARLIQVVNSPIYRGREPVQDVRHAITRLGMQTVRTLATSLAMRQMFQSTSEAIDQRLHRLWEHSTRVAATAQALAKRYTRLADHEALLAGLIHDIGALPVLARLEDYPELMEDERALDALVRKLHTRIGSHILKRWQFSPAMVAVVEQHENLTRTHEGPADYVDVVTVANVQCYFGTDHPLGRISWDNIPAFEKLGIVVDYEEVSMEDRPDGGIILDEEISPDDIDAIQSILLS